MFYLRKEQVPYTPISITLETKEDYQAFLDILILAESASRSVYPGLVAKTQMQQTVEALHGRLIELRNKPA